ncbi:uncharacterized protein [Cherax quadricarinatus]|uniref:uncharacterized protein n=1 Tax=Cherax quadricarinatus TaxID=27406 RepID=UPI002378F2C3|nr:uncharacterized protein LOC128691341 [Cherax quadricarinatus]
MEERNAKYDTPPGVRYSIIQYGRNEDTVTESRHEMCNILQVKYETFCGIINRDRKNNPNLQPSKEKVNANKQGMKQRRQKEQQQHYQGAVADANQAREPKIYVVSDDETEGINEADTLYKRGNYRKALDRYNELVNSTKCKDKELPHVFLMMANAYFISDFENAKTYYDRAIEEATETGNELVKRLAEQNRNKVQNAVQNLGNIALADDKTELDKVMASLNDRDK